MQDFTTRPTVVSTLTPLTPLSPQVTRLSAQEYTQWQESQALYQEAQACLAKAQASAEDILEKARQQGLEEGRELARTELFDAIHQINGTMKHWVEDTEESLRDIVGQCVEGIVQQADKDVMVKEAVHQGLAKLHKAHDIEIQVCPQQVSLVEELVEHLQKNQSVSYQITISPNPQLQLGDCFVNSPIGVVDFSLKNRLGRIQGALGL